MYIDYGVELGSKIWENGRKTTFLDNFRRVVSVPLWFCQMVPVPVPVPMLYFGPVFVF